MLGTGILFAVMAIVGVIALVAVPEVRLTGAIWAVGFGLLAPVFLYIGWPSVTPGTAGMHKAKATIMGVAQLPGDVAGYPLVELELEVRQKDRMPYPVTRRFVANRLRRIELGQVIDVRVDPENPERVELA